MTDEPKSGGSEKGEVEPTQEPEHATVTSMLMAAEPTGVVQAIKLGFEAVPAVKYAAGIAGVMASLALGMSFLSTASVAVTGALTMLVLMVLLLVFTAATTIGPKALRVPALFLTWAFLLLFVFSATMVVFAVFFDWPRPYAELVQKIFGDPNPKADTTGMDGNKEPGKDTDKEKAAQTSKVTRSDWMTHVDWAIANSGTGPSTDCPQEYPYHDCVSVGGRSCLMNYAIQSAKNNHCENALRVTAITQCHNQGARQQIVAAGAQAVCDYLKTK